MPYKDKEKQRECQRKFYKNNKSYYAKKRKEKQQEIRAFIKDYRSDLKCERCPEDHPSVLDFHHNNPDEKEIGISEIYRRGWGQERIMKEIDKCIVLCSNCHRKLHYKLNNSQ